ncbi:cytochrome ubiquinol oxidase subunit I [Sulfitobacter sp. BDSS02]|nr:cytochrome ubiquinol oxidase subunit I [Sulfitobacter sp. BDSS02]MBR9852212.1 cytochrome ubiquinol oxidase subunit I [Paracoccaceae bacterium]
MAEPAHPLLGLLDRGDIVFVDAWRQGTSSAAVAAAAGGIAVAGLLAMLVLLTVRGWWRPLWRDWLTSLDHKKIGIMYIVLALVMFARALAEAVVMRTQQAVAVGDQGFLSGEHFGQLFSTHGSIMIFFMAMPFLTGLINYVMPIQIGARDMSFPFMNAVSLGLTTAGAALVMTSLVIGRFSTGGWSGYPPFTGIDFSSGPGVDYWIWAITLTSVGSTLTGINFAVTLYKERAPGMHLMRMPLFCWTALCTSILMVFSMTPLTLATLMLWLDRHFGFHFFTVAAGGNLMNYANLFWLFGHPEVYILILPAFGVWSEVISTFSGKALYGYRSMVCATMCIAVLSFTVWLHHFFTMGQSAQLNAVFGIATMAIGIPTGVKVYDWLLTMWRGRIRFTAPMLFATGFLVSFVIGGMTGVILANPTVDFAVHNSLFLVAHFHNMLIPGLLFGMIAGLQFWFPLAFGFRLEERWGIVAFALFFAGFYLAFMPLYAMGLMGAARRSSMWQDATFSPWLTAALFGALMIAGGFIALIVQITRSIRHRAALSVPAGDPWDGRSLEWALPAPTPEWNFPVQPEVSCRDAFLEAKRADDAYQMPDRFEDIDMPRHTAVPAVIGAALFLASFGIVWQIWWLAGAGALGALAAWIARSFQRETTRTIPAAEIERVHRDWLETLSQTAPVPREHESTAANRGLAKETAT